MPASKDAVIVGDTRDEPGFIRAEIKLGEVDRESDFDKSLDGLAEAALLLKKFLADGPNHGRAGRISTASGVGRDAAQRRSSIRSETAEEADELQWCRLSFAVPTRSDGKSARCPRCKRPRVETDLERADRQGLDFSVSPGFFSSTEQAFDIQVETPSLGRIHPWSKTQTTMNATTPINSFMTVLFASMNFIPFRRSHGSRCWNPPPRGAHDSESRSSFRRRIVAGGTPMAPSTNSPFLQNARVGTARIVELLRQALEQRPKRVTSGASGGAELSPTCRWIFERRGLS
jgi:hypothetical protein